jgi:hypothetical protein
LAAVLSALWTTCALAELSAELSSTSVRAGQSVMLTLSSTGPAQPAPDLSPLQQDFQITNRSTREEVSVVNGQRRERRELRLTLMPRRSGTLTVPAIHAGTDASSPIALTVATTTTTDSRLLSPPPGTTPREPRSTAPLSLSVQAQVEPTRVKVQQQVLLRTRVTSRDALPAGRLHEPSISGARVLPLGEDRRSETTDAGELQVYERHFAIFPSVAGTLTIPALRFDAWRVSGGDPLPFESDPLAVKVDPVPAEASPGVSPEKAGAASTVGNKPWLPARSLSLTEAGPPTVRIAPGQALERMITLRADGIMAEDLPMIPLAIPFQLRISDDAPRLWNERTPEGVVGYRSERILIGTEEEGTYQLPGATIDWWNTTTESWQQATLPDWTLTVAPFASADRRPAAIWDRPTAAESGRPAGVPPRDSTQPSETGRADSWKTGWTRAQPWLAVVALVIGLVVVLVLMRVRAQYRDEHRSVISRPPAKPSAEGASAATPDGSAATAQTPLAAAITAVERAYLSGDATGARQALLRWGELVLPTPAPANLAQLASRVEPPLRDEILLLEKAFFSPQPIDWTQAQLWHRLGSTTGRAGGRTQGSSLTADA